MERVADGFAGLVLDKARRIKFGDPMDPATDLGTVVSEDAARTFERRVYDAAEQGAKVLYDPGRKGRCCRRSPSTSSRTGAELVFARNVRPGHSHDPRRRNDDAG